MRTIRLLMGSALAVVVLAVVVSGGCARLGPIEPSPLSDTVTVRVIATQPTKNCAARFPARQNACPGVSGETDGLACGMRGDVIVWEPGNPVTGISSVRFAAGNRFVCGKDELRQANGSYRCVLQPQPQSAARGLALTYIVGVTFQGSECPDEVDPYVIIVYR